MKVLGSLILALALVESVQGSRGNNIVTKVAGGSGSGGGRTQRKRMMMAKPQKSGGGSLRASNQVPDFMLPNNQLEASQTFVQEQDIIDGSWLLYNIKFKDEVFIEKGSDYKGQVYGFFCKLDLSAQKDDPSQVPFFMNFVREGKCSWQENHVKLDLYDIVQKTRAYDLEHANDPSNTIKSIPPTAFLYHEGRCGSTLVSNSVTALEPERTRTYSEPMPPLLALLECDKTRANCNVDKAANLFRDVIYMMGRTSNPVEDRLFFKLLPSSVLAVDVVKQAFPDVPWAFIYRDPLHVMVSNLREKATDNAPGPYCTGLKPQKLQSEYIQDLVLSVPGKTVEDLTHEEYCAAYLATLTTAAAEELAFTEGGIGVNYADMPEVLLDKVFPEHFGLPVGEPETERVLSQFGVYSKRMKTKNPKEARDDSADKEKEASAEVREAVNLFLSDSYGKLQLLKNSDLIPQFQRQLTNKLEKNEQEYSLALELYDPMLAYRQRQLQANPTPVMCTVTNATICCPQGTIRAVTNAGFYEVPTTTDMGGTTLTPTCFASYTPCLRTTTYDCPFFTVRTDNGGLGDECAGLTYFYTEPYYDLEYFYVLAEAACPEPTSMPTPAPTTAPTTAPTSAPTSSPTSGPTTSPVTSATTTSPVTSAPTTSPVTGAPTTSPVTSAPTTSPVTSAPTSSPISTPPTSSPIIGPTDSPTFEEDPVTGDLVALGIPSQSCTGNNCAIDFQFLGFRAFGRIGLNCPVSPPPPPPTPRDPTCVTDEFSLTDEFSVARTDCTSMVCPVGFGSNPFSVTCSTFPFVGECLVVDCNGECNGPCIGGCDNSGPECPLCAPTSQPTSQPTSVPTLPPTSIPTATPTVSAQPSSSAAPTGLPTEPNSSAPSLPFCADATPVCPVTGYSKSKGKGKGSSAGEDSVPICVATETKLGTDYQTLCVTPSYLQELAQGGSSKSKGRKLGMMMMKKKKTKSAAPDLEYSCGCCDPLLEGDSYPPFCDGPICAEDPTPCGPIGHYGHHGRSLGFANNKQNERTRYFMSTGGKMMMMMKSKKQPVSAPPLAGVTICVAGKTVCVDEFDEAFLGPHALDYTCGAC